MSNNQLDQHRIMWIDICKCFGISLVVALHYGVPTDINGFCHQFHMPVFFVLSGYCLNIVKYNRIRDFIVKRIKTLIVPYILFSVLSFLFWNIIYYLWLKDNIIPFKQYIYCLFLDTTTTMANIWGGIQWFLPALFFTEIIFFVFVKQLKGKIAFICLLILSLLGYVLPHVVNWRLPLAFDCALSMLPFYGIGYFARNNIPDIFVKIKDRKLYINFILLILFGGIAYITYKLNGAPNVRELQYGNVILFLLGAFSGILVLIVCSLIFDKLFSDNSLIKRYIVYIGQNTLIILYIHRWLNGIFENIISLLKINFSNSVQLYLFHFFEFILCFILVYPIIKFINRYCKILIGKF